MKRYNVLSTSLFNRAFDRKVFVPVFLLLGLAAVVTNVNALSYTKITSQAGLGSSGSNVSAIQSFLASNPNIYPQGLVTGYFGSFTADAVSNFQLQYGLPVVGRVGPMTMAKMNALIDSGYGLDVASPFISNLAVSPTSGSAQISWITNESATAKIYYGTFPLMVSEGDITGSGLAVLNGNLGANDNFLSVSKNFVLSNLSPNTLYYYTIVATDASGNVSMTPINSFRTTQ